MNNAKGLTEGAFILKRKEGFIQGNYSVHKEEKHQKRVEVEIYLRTKFLDAVVFYLIFR